VQRPSTPIVNVIITCERLHRQNSYGCANCCSFKKILAPNDTFSDGAPSPLPRHHSLKKQSMVYSMFVSALAGRFGSISLSSAVAKPSSEVVGIDIV
jgi:hypothetical protein